MFVSFSSFCLLIIGTLLRDSFVIWICAERKPIILSDVRACGFYERSDMKIKMLMPLDAESRRLIDWMEKSIDK
ncbi:hypothetical protein IEQ34_007799 [Dendrobium chrysotoxum]|uniref:Uncharacterized protein n=1 Tax=Dendrobium chrysotoxum TaxID=161865 RepID=A0AAV7H5R8_DENCH|nr:hypothetical protein IEQ34_007799 [Dendrobium chrysotoxum]